MPQATAILVDGDNLGARHAATILSIGRKQGDPTIVRAYLDARKTSEWHAALVHAGCGKNASDILLAIEAMDLAHLQGIRCFIIATSDGDFTHLAIRLRELGAKVAGAGEGKTPQAFRASCSSFVELPAAKPAVFPVCGVAPIAATGVTDLDKKIRTMIAQHSKEGAGMRIADLAPKMHVEHGIRISTLPQKTWRNYLTARPVLFDLDPRGPEAMVRFRSEGFASAT